MGFDVGSTTASSSTRTQAIPGILLEKSCDKILRLNRDGPIVFTRPLNVVIDNVRKELFRRLAEKWDAANEELVEDDSRCPPIDRFSCMLKKN